MEGGETPPNPPPQYTIHGNSIVADDRRRTTDDRRPMMDDGRPTTDDGRQRTEDGQRTTDDGRQIFDDRQHILNISLYLIIKYHFTLEPVH
jgi:hypothetical protein